MEKYYIVDYGTDTLDLAELVIQKLKNQEHHVLVAFTDLSNYLGVEEVSEDTFLDCFSLVNDN